MKSKPHLLFLLVLSLIATSLQPHILGPTRAQESTDTPLDRVAVHQALLDLTNPWTVMCIAAHPDDEDGTSLTVLRHKYGVHTVSLFSTFGEGGQNAVGPELYEQLGVIRARETMAAAEIQGSEPYFLGLKDFGFSKSADEAFRIWGHEEALRRMVQKIRELRPDVIITNHDTTSGHGHHQATGRLLLEAFDAAADPQKFPDQIKGDVTPWQVKRVYVRGFGRGQAAQTDAPVVTIDPNERDEVRGTTFAEQALAALQKHQTQGPWPKTVADMARMRNSTDGRLPVIRYTLVRTAKDTPAPPKTASTFLEGLTLPEAEAASLRVPAVGDKALESQDPDSVLEALLQARKAGAFATTDNSDAPRFRLMNNRLNRALAALSGVTMTITPSDPVLMPGNTTNFVIDIADNGTRETSVSKLTLSGFGSEHAIDVSGGALVPGTDMPKALEIKTPANATISVPSDTHLYDGRLFGEHFTARATIKIADSSFEVTTERKFDVGPAVEIDSISPSPFVWSPATGNQPLSFKVALTNNQARPFAGTLAISSARRIAEAGQKISLAPRESREVTLDSNAMPSGLRKTRGSKPAPAEITLAVRAADTANEITSDTIPFVYAPAQVKPGLRVGFVPSFDQTIEDSLKALGVNATRLRVSDIQTADLKPYHTIIIDNRGYEAHPELIAANDKLLTFVKEGGTLLVFYHKDNEWNPNPQRNRPQLAPYPIVLNGDRVTDENAKVTFLKPGHRLLNSPNRITQADFQGWIQERGLYYPKQWDEHYEALFAMNDPGEQPLKGGLLVGSYGDGEYIYTSMVWYRELREGIPGAYKMFANMISYDSK